MSRIKLFGWLLNVGYICTGSLRPFTFLGV